MSIVPKQHFNKSNMNLFRPDVDRVAGYIPGEQPQESGWVKLNTNENPYPPSPQVVEAIAEAAGGRLNVYPDPLATRFRRRAAELLDVDPDWILPANGSDENLTILIRSFVDPGELVSYPYPSYTLYKTLAELQGAEHEQLPLNADWSWNYQLAEPIVERSKLVFVPNPNSPSGNLWSNDDISRLIPRRGILVLDEAYVDFSDAALGIKMLSCEAGNRIVITRTLSKSYSLAGMRFGFAIACPELIFGMRKVKDSYNCNALSLAAAVAALEDIPWMQRNVQNIQNTRVHLTGQLERLGFDVVHSQANFVWATHSNRLHKVIYESLKQRRILVRYMHFYDKMSTDTPEIDGLRITVGTDSEIDRLLQALEIIV